VSALNMLNRCPEQFRRRYIEKEIRKPGIALLVGTATDRSVTADLKQKIDTGVLLPVDEVKAIARDTFMEEWDRGVQLSEDERIDGLENAKDKAVSKSVRLASLHHEELAPQIEPTHVQRDWVLDLEDYPVELAGTFDVQEGFKSIDDTKTTAKSKSQSEADKSLQLTTYAFAQQVLDGQPVESLKLNVLVDTQVPKVQVLTTKRTERDFDVLFNRIENAVEVMQKGVYPPTSIDDPLCSPRFCGYYGTCKYVHQIQIAV
jgi:hypothetical protein